MNNFTNNFKLINRFFLDNKTHGEVFHYSHISGAEVISVQNSDEENLFCFGFKTPPLDNKGTAHILEHTVLCGSKNYPIKDPFLSLLKGSMQTFLNAMTYPDKTLYPAASPVKKDFFNLLDVYGDAVFNPLLKEEAFRQESHRLELDNDSLKRVGIVYNEMKGVYSSFENFSYDKSITSLFKTNCYQYDSGGDPAVIPSLTYNEFVDFHKRYYHASNCKIFLYGDIDLEEKLNYLHDRFLKDFSKVKVDNEITNEVPFSMPTKEELYFATDSDENKKATVSVNFLLNDSSNYNETLALKVLAYILLSSDGAPFYMALQNSHFGEDVSPISGFSDSYKQNVFVAGLREVDEENIGKVEYLVMDTLKNIMTNGIDNNEIEAALRSIEMSARRVKSGPMGLHVMRRLYKDWVYNLDIKDTFAFDKHIAYLRDEAFKPNFFENLISKYFINSQHRSLVITRPSKDLYKKEQEKELASLKEMYKNLTSADITKLRDEATKLKEYQNSTDITGIAPKLSRKDVPTKITKIDYSEELLGDKPLLITKCNTNGIFNFMVAFDISNFSEDELKWLPFLCHILGSVGFKDGTSYDEASRLIDLHTGDLTFDLDSQLYFDNHVETPTNSKQYLYLSLKNLAVQLDDSVGIIDKVINQSDFTNTDRLKDLFLENYLNFKSDIVPSASNFIGMYLSSLKQYSAYIESLWFGLHQFMFLDKEKDKINDATYLDNLATTLDNLCKKAFNLSVATFHLSSEVEDEAKAKATINKIKSVIKQNAVANDFSSETHFKPSHKKIGFSVFSLVNYVGVSLNSSNNLSLQSASERILCQHLNASTLWEEIRMKGGAYGASMQLNLLEKTCNFTSYRDPNLLKTIETFKRVLTNFSDFTEDKLDDALIAVVGKETKPLSSNVKSFLAFRRYLYNYKDEIKQTNLDNLFKVKTDDVMVACKNFSNELQTANIAIIASKEELLKAKETGIIDEIINLS